MPPPPTRTHTAWIIVFTLIKILHDILVRGEQTREILHVTQFSAKIYKVSVSKVHKLRLSPIVGGWWKIKRHENGNLVTFFWIDCIWSYELFGAKKYTVYNLNIIVFQAFYHHFPH